MIECLSEYSTAQLMSWSVSLVMFFITELLFIQQFMRGGWEDPEEVSAIALAATITMLFWAVNGVVDNQPTISYVIASLFFLKAVVHIVVQFVKIARIAALKKKTYVRVPANYM